MKRFQKYAALVLALALCLCTLPVRADENRVVIFSSAEEFRNEYYQQRLNETFPDYQIVIEYLSTGSHAARLQAEGVQTDCDISLDLDMNYMDMLGGGLAELTDFDQSNFADDLAVSRRYVPFERNSGAIILNTQVMEKYNLPVPASYQDLLKPEYQDLISMPNPKSSGTGYIFLKSLVNAWGEEDAFAYFDQLADRVLSFTSSGSGPLNALLQGEVAIGLGMLSPAVAEKNNGAPLEIIFFDEGTPYNGYGVAVIEGKQNSKAVMDVFHFIATTLCDENSQRWFPEYLFKDRSYQIEGYPEIDHYADMSGATAEEKLRLLDRWEY